MPSTLKKSPLKQFLNFRLGFVGCLCLQSRQIPVEDPESVWLVSLLRMHVLRNCGALRFGLVSHIVVPKVGSLDFRINLSSYLFGLPVDARSTRPCSWHLALTMASAWQVKHPCHLVPLAVLVEPRARTASSKTQDLNNCHVADVLRYGWLLTSFTG